MLFDDKDLSIFENNESKVYFKEIVQLYYSQNYRSSIVMLCSFVIYDLHMKLQTMADEVTDFFIHHIEELSDDSIKKLMKIYNNNNQFKNRYRHSKDMEIIKNI